MREAIRQLATWTPDKGENWQVSANTAAPGRLFIKTCMAYSFMTLDEAEELRIAIAEARAWLFSVKEPS